MAKTQAEPLAAPLRLRSRAQFLRVRQGKIAHSRGLVLQAAPRVIAAQGEALTAGGGVLQAPLAVRPRFGFTVSRRCGKAVRRNRIRRRLKEALRLLEPLPAEPGHDYVIVARPEALGMAFPALQAALVQAFNKILAQKGDRASRIAQEGAAARGSIQPGPRDSTGRTSKR